MLEGPGPGRLRLALTFRLLAILGLQAARLAWIFLAPGVPLPLTAPSAATTPIADPAILDRFNPFKGASAVPSAQPAATVEGQILILYGLRTGGRSASAIIGPRGDAQKAYGVGDEIAPGVVLNAIDSDHVVISRGGILTNLPLVREKVGLAPGSMLLFPNGQTRGGEGAG